MASQTPQLTVRSEALQLDLHVSGNVTECGWSLDVLRSVQSLRLRRERIEELPSETQCTPT
jgi:hypothetical protein